MALLGLPLSSLHSDFNDTFEAAGVMLDMSTTTTTLDTRLSNFDPNPSNIPLGPCNLDLLRQNWNEELVTFITTHNPYYFTNRPWIIGGLFAQAIVGLLANVGVICYLAYSAHGCRLRMSASNLLVLQLAIADTLVCLFCLLTDAIWNVTMQWVASTELCRFVKFMQMFSLYGSTMILTGMTVERCINITYPLSYSRPDTALFRSRIISVAVWVLAAICSIPQAIIFHVEKAPTCADFYQCVTHGAYTSRVQEVAYTMSTLCIMFVIPLIIFAACFVIFLKTSQESRIALGASGPKVSSSRNAVFMHSKLFQPLSVPVATTDDTDRLHDFNGVLEVLELQASQHVISSPGYGRCLYRRARLFSIWMTFGIALAYIVCWAPYYVSMVAYLFDYEISNGWMTLILSSGMISTLLNPIIYSIFKFVSIRRDRVIPNLVLQLRELHATGLLTSADGRCADVQMSIQIPDIECHFPHGSQNRH